MQTENRAAGGGITFLGLLQVAFIVLKLCGVVTWPWSVVLIPLWIDIAIVAIVLIIWIAIIIKARR